MFDEKNKNPKDEWAIPEDAAEAQIDVLLEYYDVDPEKDIVKEVRPTLLRHVMRGRVEISLDDEADLVVIQNLKYPPSDKKSLKYQVISGKNKKQMKSNAKSDHEKMYSLMGSLSGGGGEPMSRLKGVDNSAMEALANIFLSV